MEDRQDRLSLSQMAQLQLRQRRSSIMAQAKKDGVLPELRGSMGGGVGTGRPAEPTPLARPGLRRPGGPAPAQNAQRNTLQRKTIASNTASAKGAKGPQGSVQKGSVTRSAKGPVIPSRVKAVPTATASTSTAARKQPTRSISLSDVFKTPASSYKTPEPKSTMSRWGSQGSLAGGREREGKGLKIPGTRDFKQLNELTQSVHCLLVSIGLDGIPPSPNDLKNITTQKFYNICAAVGERFVGKRFFETEDIVTALVDMSRLLDYPGSITKSHMKSATSQHSWPQSLTYLAWLCHRFASACEEEQDDDRMYFDEGFPFQIATPSYRRLYATHENHPSDYEEAMVREMNQFKLKATDHLLGEVRESMEELQEAKVGVQAELAAVLASPDPGKNAMENIKSIEQQIASIELSKAKLNEQRAIYLNTHSLLAQIKSLKMDLVAVQTEMEKLHAVVTAQPFDIAAALAMKKETEELVKTREYYSSLFMKIQEDIDVKQTEDAELKAKYLQVLTEFSVVERYNATINDIKANQLAITPNPAPSETTAMKKWLKNVDKIQHQTEQFALKWVDALKGEIAGLSELYKLAQKDFSDLKSKLTTKTSYVKHGKSQLQLEEQNLKSTCNQLESELESRNASVETIREKIQAIEKDTLNSTEELKRLQLSNQDAINEMSLIEKSVEKLVDACKAEIAQAKADGERKIREVAAENEALLQEAEKFVKALEEKFPEMFVDNKFWKMVRDAELNTGTNAESTLVTDEQRDEPSSSESSSLSSIDNFQGHNNTAQTMELFVQDLSELNIQPSFPGSSST